MRHLSYRLQLFASLIVAGLVPVAVLALTRQLSFAGPAMLLMAVGLLMLLGGLAWTLTSVQSQPLEHLITGARRLREGALQEHLLVPEQPQLAEIATAMNELAGRLSRVSDTLEHQVRERTVALERKASQLRAVGEVGRQVAAVLDTGYLLHFVASVLRGTFGYDAVAVLLRRGDALELAACAARGQEEAPVGRLIPLAQPCPVTRAVREGISVAEGASPLVGGLEAKSELAVPIRLGDQVLGVLAAQSRAPDAFADDDRFTLQTLAGQVAVALENGRLLAAERQLRDLAIAEERNRMAREIHDTLAQGFMGILLQMRAAEQVLSSPDDLRFHLEQARNLATQNLQEARRSVWNLRPRPLDGRTLGEALAGEVETVGHRAAMDARFEQVGEPVSLPPAVEAALLRCTQEALNNAVKHSRATALVVTLRNQDTGLELTVSDNGCGFDPGALPEPVPGGGGFGLTAMTDRARAAGGAVAVESQPGSGTVVRIHLPTPGGR